MAQRRVALYLRISEDRTGEGLAVDRQRQDCVNLVQSRGWTLAGEYVDNDISAAGKRKRPSFLRLVEDVSAGRVDVVVAWALDRLVRTPRDRLNLVETCRTAGVSIVLVRGSDMDLTTAAGRLFAGLLGEVAQHEIDVKSERHRRQAQQAAEAGMAPSGPRPFGYKKGGKEQDPVEAAAVAELYSRFLAGSGLGELTDWLNRRGFTTPKGYRWRPSSVRTVLANPRNAGLRGLKPVVDEKTGKRAQWHHIVGPGKWPGIVDEPTWRAAVQILRDPNRIGRNNTLGGAQPQHLLSRIAICGRCGLHMHASSGGAGIRTYKCSSKMHLIRNAIQLERYVERVALARLRRPDAVGLLVNQDDSVDLAQWREDAIVLRTRLAGLAADYADGILDRDQMRVSSNRLRDQLVELEARIGDMGQVDVLAPLVLADDDAAARRVWDDYPTSTKRLVISRIMRITVLRGRVGRPPAGAGFDPESVRIEWVG